MKKIFALYYITILLTIIFAFISIARYSFGLTLLGYCGFGLTLIFIIQILKSSKTISKVEFFLLTILSLLLSLRALFIHFRYVEIIFAITAFLLFFLYLIKSLKLFGSRAGENKKIGISLNLGVAFFAISLAITPYAPGINIYTGALSASLILFAVITGISGLIKNDKSKNPFKLFINPEDATLFLVTMVLIFSSYAGLTKVGLLPELYTEKYPQVYQEMVKQSELGEGEKVEGKNKHELYLENYEKFAYRHLSK